MLKPKLLIRLASGCLLFFAMGHSIGHFTRHQTTDSRAAEALKLMAENKFDMFGFQRSFDDNYTGMSLNLIFTLITFAILLFIISGFVTENRKVARWLVLPVALCALCFSVTSFLYFFHVPGITCLVASMLLFIAWIKLQATKIN